MYRLHSIRLFLKLLPAPCVANTRPLQSKHLLDFSTSIMQLRDEVNGIPSRGRLSTLRRHTQQYSRPIWTISAINALLSARHLLVEANFHYPVVIYIAQIVVAAVVVGIHHAVTLRDAQAKSWRSLGKPGAVLGMSAMCCAAFSMMCMLQALLHYKNLPALVMLAVSYSSRKIDV